MQSRHHKPESPDRTARGSTGYVVRYTCLAVGLVILVLVCVYQMRWPAPVPVPASESILAPAKPVRPVIGITAGESGANEIPPQQQTGAVRLAHTQTPATVKQEEVRPQQQAIMTQPASTPKPSSDGREAIAPPRDLTLPTTSMPKHLPVRSPENHITSFIPSHSEQWESVAYARELITDLLYIPPEFPSEIDQTVQELSQLGSVAVPVIQEFLDTEKGTHASALHNDEAAKQRAVRLGLIDALTKIGGPEALSILTQRLQSTTDPEEIALLAQGVARQAAGIQREEVLTIARKLMDLAAEAPHDVDNIGQLLNVFATLGDAQVVTDLEAAFPHWNSFSIMALTELPEGMGIPTLIRIVEDGDLALPEKQVAWQMLTQASRIYPEAQQAIVDLARQYQIPKEAWPKIAAALEGREWQLLMKDEAFKSVMTQKVGYAKSMPAMFRKLNAPENWSDEDIDQRLVLIDQLLEADPPPEDVERLEAARASLLQWREFVFIDGKRIRLADNTVSTGEAPADDASSER